MILRIGAFLLLFAALLVIPSTAQTHASKPDPAAKESPGELVDRVGNTGFVQIHAGSFRDLTSAREGAGVLADAGCHRD